MNKQPNFWAVVPAAGVGRRMGGAIPKQYLQLNGRPVIEYTLERLLSHPKIHQVMVALSPTDQWWPDTTYADNPDVIRVDGGMERCHSVLNALHTLGKSAAIDDWVLVHDAARPCLRREDIDRLIEQLASHPVGGILGTQVRDTMKRADESNQIQKTVCRKGLWHAFTPQMFRFGLLRDALSEALEQGQQVTDEASAMELTGQMPMLVEGHADNIKITRPEDLALAEFYLHGGGD
ncbi:2-C-methyl-D-erythritol 4-phosphate cytidylyltransferase [hydrothermal vent metagenome]|uniref:2-C-methyl-D-erythritol 4-phosphate cytidylyltransferase n=1 Tax=hydrothermal vent metagenome TaxID=652676 RepID=A0A3B1BC48_9ZZZZ